MSTGHRAWVEAIGTPATDSLEFSVPLTGLTFVHDFKKAVQQIAELECCYPRLTIEAKYDGTPKQLDAQERVDSVLDSFGGSSVAFLVTHPGGK